MALIKYTEPDIKAHNNFYSEFNNNLFNEKNAKLMASIAVSRDGKITISAFPELSKDILVKFLYDSINEINK